MNVSLALIWQWWRIAKMLKDPDKELEEMKAGRSTSQLKRVQIVLFFVLVIDCVVLYVHYGLDKWTST